MNIRTIITAGGIGIAAGAALLFASFAAPAAHAADALQLVITWEAHNFYPSNYPLKAATTGNTPVTVSVAGVRNGQFVDFSGADVAWWRDSSFLSKGKGMTSVRFNVEWRYKRPGTEYFMRAIVTLGGEQFETAVNIPVEAPRVALRTPYFQNRATRGNTVTVTAIPYFFNVRGLDELTFEWTIDGKKQPAAEGQNVATVTIADDETLAGDYIPVYVRATNVPLLERAEQNINVLIQ